MLRRQLEFEHDEFLRSELFEHHFVLDARGQRMDGLCDLVVLDVPTCLVVGESERA